MMKWKTFLGIILVALIICLAKSIGDLFSDNTSAAESESVSIADIELAKTCSSHTAQVIRHIGYTTSYNSDWLIPNWVAYSLTETEVNGTFKRPKKEFEPDPQVKGNSAVHRDYTNSGFSRGHMAPAADMKWSEQAMLESFYLSNVCPQLSDFNAGVWERLENRIRALASESTVYICCGPIVEKKHEKIGYNGVAVPSRFFKVLCMKRRGQWQAIGFVFPYTACKGSMFGYACTVDEVETLTGHDFFYNLPDDIETDVESSFRSKSWQ